MSSARGRPCSQCSILGGIFASFQFGGVKFLLYILFVSLSLSRALVWDVDFLYLNLVKTSESGTLEGRAAIGIPTESNKVL